MPKILVVDDDPTLVDVVRTGLEIEGFDTLGAHDGLAALAMLRAEQPDVMLLDYLMPALTGLQVLEALVGAGDRPPRTVILMVTSLDSAEARRACLQAGADDYLIKPVDPRDVAEKLNALRGDGRTA